MNHKKKGLCGVYNQYICLHKLDLNRCLNMGVGGWESEGPIAPPPPNPKKLIEIRAESVEIRAESIE